MNTEIYTDTPIYTVKETEKINKTTKDASSYTHMSAGANNYTK